LVPLKLGEPLQASCDWSSDYLLTVTHRAMRRVPRVAAVWDLLLEHAPPLLG